MNSQILEHQLADRWWEMLPASLRQDLEADIQKTTKDGKSWELVMEAPELPEVVQFDHLKSPADESENLRGLHSLKITRYSFPNSVSGRKQKWYRMSRFYQSAEKRGASC